MFLSLEFQLLISMWDFWMTAPQTTSVFFFQQCTWVYFHFPNWSLARLSMQLSEHLICPSGFSSSSVLSSSHPYLSFSTHPLIHSQLVSFPRQPGKYGPQKIENPFEITQGHLTREVSYLIFNPLGIQMPPSQHKRCLSCLLALVVHKVYGLALIILPVIVVIT